MCSDSKLDCVVATQQQNPSSSGDTPAARQNPLGRALAGWRIYTQQPVLPAAFALALLYLTVMSLGASAASLRRHFVRLSSCCRAVPFDCSALNGLHEITGFGPPAGTQLLQSKLRACGVDNRPSDPRLQSIPALHRLISNCALLQGCS